MKTGFTPWSEAMLEDLMRLQRAACFSLGCIEREQRLNLHALATHWAHASLVWWAPLLPRQTALPREASASVTSRPSGASLPEKDNKR